jgi:DNA-binding transcriptional LysR family regulator
MEIRQIRCFVAVAEELHFRKAAERIGLAQTALSAQVRNLEEELGFPLLFRTTRHVSLTQAGAVFLQECRALLDGLEEGVDRARKAATEEMQRLRIGGIDAALVWFLPPVIEAFRRAYPGLHLPLTEVSASSQQVQELLRHRIDVAFFRPPAADEGITWETLFEEQVFAALPEDHPLAEADSVSALDLQTESIISYPRSARPYLAAAVTDSFAAEGLRPCIDLEVLDKSTLLQLVARGAGIGFVPQWVTERPMEGVRFCRYVSAVTPMQFGVGWRSQDKGASLRAFLDLARTEANHVKERFAVQAE